MPNIPGAPTALPGPYTDVITQSRGVSIPGGARIPTIIGEGSTDEVVVSSANGGGKDGLNSTYTSTTGQDGRHFQLQNYPLISNRTTVYRNGTPLTGVESTGTGSFSYKYSYRLNITTGRLEMQAAHLVDLGGSNYSTVSTNVGIGALNSLTLVDLNAPQETWTVRCVSVRRDVYNAPIAGTAKFIAIGTLSGTKLDSFGNAIIWTADGYLVSNSILSFAIVETNPSYPFREGDAFTIQVSSGVLSRGDSLTVNCIPELNINDPVVLQGMDAVLKRHGSPSLDNNLSLGAQLAFANSSPVIISTQAAPPMPRRTSYTLSDAVHATSTSNDDFIFPLPAGVVPDPDAAMHFFITDNTTGVETQILPNKLDYYLLDTGGYPTTTSFITDDVSAPSGYSYFYTVKKGYELLATGLDGYIGRDTSVTNKGVFSSATTFDANYVGKRLLIIDATNTANISGYTVTSVINGDLHVTHDAFVPFIAEPSGVRFSVINPATDATIISATDGYIVSPSSATATFSSLTVDFSAITSLTAKRIRVTGSATDNGDYDIVSYTSGANTLVIEKAVVTESNMRYEVVDTASTSDYVVINHNVVPDTQGLRVTIVDSRDATFYDAGWLAALTALETIECDIVVPLPKQTPSVIFQNVLSHCKSMSNIKNKKERVMFCGAINGLTPDNLNGTELAAVEDIGVLEGIQGDSVTEVLAGNIEDLANYSVPDAFGNTYRCVYFYPDQIIVQAGADRILIDGMYLAAAAAGYLAASLRIEEPLTNKVLTGFSILRNKQFSTFTLEQLVTSGVTVLQPVSGGGRVIWGITTTQSGYPEEQEISIIFIRDRIAKSLRSGFAGYIGTAETPDTQAILNTRAVQLLNSLASQGLLTAYADLIVQRDEIDPRQWNVSVRVQPTYPINWILIKVSVGQL
jgi:hypothetical protein